MGQGFYSVGLPPQACHSPFLYGRLVWAFLRKETVSRVIVASVSIKRGSDSSEKKTPVVSL